MSPAKSVQDRLKSTFDKIHQGLEELEELLNANLTNTGVGTRAKEGTAKAPATTQTALPTPLTPAPKPNTLTDATRKESWKAGLPIATNVAKVVAPGSQMYLDGLRGQLTLERIPFDDQLLMDLTNQVGRGQS